MKKFGIELKWGVIFALVTLLWMVLEKQLGWHDELISKHAVYTNFFAIVAIALYVVALFDKRKNFYNGKMTWFQGFLTGIGISAVIAILSPLNQYIINAFISPEYFSNAITFAVSEEKMIQEAAEKYFSLNSYMVQSVIGALLMGAVTSAVVALITKRR